MRPELLTPPREPYLLVIKVDGTVTYEPLDTVPDHIKLHAAVDGDLELVPMFTRLNGSPCIAFCDEEGKLHGKTVNALANVLWADALGFMPDNDILVGTIAIVVGSHSFLGQL